MKTYCDKRHRIRHRKDGTRAVPQWKGLLFWHDYRYWPIDIDTGMFTMYSSSHTPRFDDLYDALKFIHAAMENEKNEVTKIGEAMETFE